MKANNTEFIEQVKVVNFIKKYYPDCLFTATAGGLYTSWQQAKKNKLAGYSRGCPDILIFEPRNNYHGMAIEMKKDQHSHPTPHQLEWINKLKKRNYCAHICYGSEEAIKLIIGYLKK